MSKWDEFGDWCMEGLITTLDLMNVVFQGLLLVILSPLILVGAIINWIKRKWNS